MAAIIDVLLFLWPAVAVPAALLLLVRPVGRLAFFAIGLAFAFGVGILANLGGPDSPMLILPFFGLCISLAAAIAEAVARLYRAIRRPGEKGTGAG